MSFGIDFSPDCFLSKNTNTQTLNPPLLLRKPKRFSFLHQANPVHLAIILLLDVTGYRFWFSTRLELVPDEAYYWLWSKHLAASYRDKGPAIAWIIALGTRMFGDSVFGIRFFAVLFSTGSSWLLFGLARRLYDERTALWCLLMATVIPILAVGSILMTIDTLSVFFWALAAMLGWDILHRGTSLEWFGLGLAIGMGFLAKFTNGMQMACIAVFLLWSKKHRPLIASRNMCVAGAAFLLAITPLIWWNLQTGWIHLMALHSRSGVEGAFRLHPTELLRFVSEQFVVVSPLFMAGIVVAAVALAWKQPEDERTGFLLSQYWPLYGVFMFFSLNKAGKANWPAPALITGIIFTVVFWREMTMRRPAWRWGIATAFAIALAMTMVLHDTELLHLPSKLDPLRRAQGWADFAAHVQRARVAHQAKVLIGNHYAQASMMAFYLPDRPVTYLPPEPYGTSQFTLWPGYNLRPDTHALFVTDSMEPPPKALQVDCTTIELVDDFWSQHHGRPMTHFRIYLCTGE
jgi:4-amino-4-deoxy-L-arabinose transferase-like glycosyltransferase